jgi:hypothetical protein
LCLHRHVSGSRRKGRGIWIVTPDRPTSVY